MYVYRIYNGYEEENGTSQGNIFNWEICDKGVVSKISSILTPINLDSV